MKTNTKANKIPKLKMLIATASLLMAPASFASWTNESELGILIAKGNSNSESLTAKETAGYVWDTDNSLKFTGRYLQTKTNDVENALFWSAGLRYDHAVSSRLGFYLGEMIESDKYAGYNQKYNTDVGAKYSLKKEPTFLWDVEAGYRYTVEKQLTGTDKKLHYLRGYTEALKLWSEGVSSKLWFEYLPNLTNSTDYQMNTELSITAALNNMFAIKTGYLLRYDNLPNPGAAKTDTLFTTSLVAKF